MNYYSPIDLNETDKNKIINDFIDYIKFKKKQSNLDVNLIFSIRNDLKEYIDYIIKIDIILNDTKFLSFIQETSASPKFDIVSFNNKNREIFHTYIYKINNFNNKKFEDNIFTQLIIVYNSFLNHINNCITSYNNAILLIEDDNDQIYLRGKFYDMKTNITWIIIILTRLEDAYNSINDPKLRDTIGYYSNKIKNSIRMVPTTISGGKNNKEYIDYKFKNKVYRRVIRYDGKKKYIILNKTRVYIKK